MNIIDKKLWEEFNKKVPNINIIEKIISEGGDINSLDNGSTLLHRFLDNILEKVNFYETDKKGNIIPFSNNIPDKNDEEKLKLLFKYGINPNIYKEDDYSCLYTSCIICLPEYVKILLENGAKPDNNKEENFIKLINEWIDDDNDFRNIKDDIDRNKNMNVIIDLLKENNRKMY